MIARLLLVPAALSLTLVACAADNNTPEGTIGNAQLGAKATNIEGRRINTEKPSWEQVNKMVSALPQPSSVLGFVPVEGVYNVEMSVIHVDECGASADAFPLISHGISEVNKRTGDYLTDYIDAGNPFAQASCALNGHQYACDNSITEIPFADFGLDAVVTINNGDFGVWDGQNTSFIGLNPYSVSCVGADCGVEPAASVFGLITQPMPCTGIDGQHLLLQL
jgi:hypothetical protein